MNEGPDELAAMLAAALSDTPAGVEIELSALAARRVALRLVDGAVSEAIDSVLQRVRVRAAVGNQVASVLVGASDLLSVRGAIAEAATRARRAPPRGYFDGFGSETVASPLPTATEEAVIAIAHEVHDEARAAGARISGAVESTTVTRAVATTRGGRAQGAERAIVLALQAAVVGDPATARDCAIAEVGAALDVATRVRKLVADVETHRKAEPPSRGTYDVVLGPAAVGELIEWLSLIGLGGRAVLDGESFLDALDGSASWFSLVDDPRLFGSLGAHFDSEGAPTPPRALVRQGRAAGCVHDRATAAEARTRPAPPFGIVASTGHAAPLDDELGDGAPIARHLAMASGALTDQELLADIDDGLYIPHLHYVNGLIDPPRAVMTGLSRHGLRRITRGRLGAPVVDLRFTESMLSAFARVDGVGARLVTLRGGLGLVRCPALRLRGLALLA